MRSNKARVAATLYDTVRRPAGAIDYTVKVMLECVILFGLPRSQKIEITVNGMKNEEDLHSTIKEELVNVLNTKYPTENFVVRDIMLFAV